MNGNFCEQSDFLAVLLVIKTIFEIITMVIPMLLIIMCSIDLVKQVLNTEEKSYQRIIKRIIAAAAVFFLPLIVNLLLNMAGQASFTAGTCWTNANKSTVNALKVREEVEKAAKQEALKKEQERLKQEKEEKIKAQEEIKQMEEEKIETDEFLKENGTDGKVTVVDGIFYKPSSGKSGAEGTKGSGPYGYNIYFYNRLQALIDAAKSHGYTISYSTTLNGAWRPLEKQEYYYNCYKTKKCNNGNLAAKPGKSNHGWGIASDMSFGSKAAKYWAHDHASEFGLAFPLCNDVRSKNNCKEYWHIEPAVLKKK